MFLPKRQSAKARSLIECSGDAGFRIRLSAVEFQDLGFRVSMRSRFSDLILFRVLAGFAGGFGFSRVLGVRL